MKVVLFAHGTRGDMAPLVVLGWLLGQRGHEITVVAPGEFREFAARAGLQTAPLPLDMIAWLRTAEGQRLLHTGGITFLRRWADEYERHADALDDAFRVAAEGAEVLVGNHITADRIIALGDALRIPAAFYIPFPLTPSREYAPLLLTSRELRSRTLRLASHELAARLWWRQVGTGRVISR